MKRILLALMMLVGLEAGASQHLQLWNAGCCTNEDGYTFLTHAMSLKKLDEVLGWIMRGVSVNETYGRGSTPLLLAISASYDELVGLLIQHKADVNQTDPTVQDTSPLTCALDSRVSDQIVKRLLVAKADVTARDKWGRTALDYANDRRNADIVKLLQEAADAEKKLVHQAGGKPEFTPEEYEQYFYSQSAEF